MPALTRRRSKDPHAESWQIFYGDVQVGTIGMRAGVPVDVDQWGWSCGSIRDQGRASTATAAWRIFLPKRTEADFQEWRDHQAFTA